LIGQCRSRWIQGHQAASGKSITHHPQPTTWNPTPITHNPLPKPETYLASFNALNIAITFGCRKLAAIILVDAEATHQP
jgi:hypothetical protein